MSSKTRNQNWIKLNKRVAQRFNRLVPQQRVDKLSKRFESEKDESRKRELGFRIQAIVAPAATVAFLEDHQQQ